MFALGVVLFELLTGQQPFKRDHDAATLNAIIREPAPVPSQLNPTIPQDVSDLILRALVKEPARRTPSAAAMREEIEAVMAHHRLNSSPAAVAQFFKATLNDGLAEFGPTQSGPFMGSFPSTGGQQRTASGSSLRAHVTPVGVGEHAGSRPRPGAGACAGPHGAMPQPQAVAAPRPPASLPPLPPVASGADEPTVVDRSAQRRFTSPKATPPEPLTRNVSAPGPSVPAVTLRARPAAGPLVPQPPAPRPAARMSGRSMAKAAPRAAPVAAPPRALALAAAVRPATSRPSPLKWVILGVVGLLVIGGAGVVVPKMFSGEGVEVSDREPGEPRRPGALRSMPRGFTADPAGSGH
ncbi:hypothetical protein [Vitiosangium sp. GDMCC 1.1324]|uniref:hypothetical protein n=1 Tax=Vitiosangium sp. (strain GDMCC 1.1324) TaxID=2138576 RepID=UPI000D3CCC36|nr:hypothetical protein DAT35_55775 [Vitiosangium sp. GDMCC 1.1324]